MVQFSLDKETSVIALEHRPKMIDMVSRLALGRIMDRSTKRGSGKDAHTTRRVMWLSYLGHMDSDEAEPFFDLLLTPFEREGSTRHLTLLGHSDVCCGRD